MDSTLKFLIKLGALKEKPRRGWQAHQIPDAETTASHIFRTIFLAWVLGSKKRLNINKLIKMALVHDICEVFAKDETSYDPLLPASFDSVQAQRKTENILQQWPKFSLAQKKKKNRLKYQREKKALRKLLSFAPSVLRREMEELWEDFEKGLSKEGRFAKQVDKAENFLQGMEYWAKYGRIQRDLWLRWAKEIFDDPVIVDFVKTIEKQVVKTKSKKQPKQNHKKN